MGFVKINKLIIGSCKVKTSDSEDKPTAKYSIGIDLDGNRHELDVKNLGEPITEEDFINMLISISEKLGFDFETATDEEMEMVFNEYDNQTSTMQCITHQNERKCMDEFSSFIGGEDLTVLGGYACDSNTFLQSISLPYTTVIGERAFSFCSYLESIDLPKATEIGTSAFYACPQIKTLNLMSMTREEIESNANDWFGQDFPSDVNVKCKDGEFILFEKQPEPLPCFNYDSNRNITGLVEDESINNKITYNYYGHEMTLWTLKPENVNIVDKYALGIADEEENSSFITRYNHNNQDVYISGLKSISLPNATSIGNYAFSECTSLTSVDLPKVTEIGKYAFGWCTSLTSIDLQKVTSIGEYAFCNCNSLASVDLSNVTSIGNYAFSGCNSLTSVDLPNATEIGEGAFNCCTSLTSIYLPNATSISNKAFTYCTSLTLIDLPNVEFTDDFINNFSDMTEIYNDTHDTLVLKCKNHPEGITIRLTECAMPV